MSNTALTIAAIYEAVVSLARHPGRIPGMSVSIRTRSPGNIDYRALFKGHEIIVPVISGRPLQAQIALEGKLSDWEVIDVFSPGCEDMVSPNADLYLRQIVELAEAISQGREKQDTLLALTSTTRDLLEDRRRNGKTPYYELRKQKRTREMSPELSAPAPAFGF